MPKKKIKKAVAKRFKITKAGKVLFRHQNNGHLQSHKSNKTIRRHNVAGVLEESFAKKVRKMLGAA